MRATTPPAMRFGAMAAKARANFAASPTPVKMAARGSCGSEGDSPLVLLPPPPCPVFPSPPSAARGAASSPEAHDEASPPEAGSGGSGRPSMTPSPTHAAQARARLAAASERKETDSGGEGAADCGDRDVRSFRARLVRFSFACGGLSRHSHISVMSQEKDYCKPGGLRSTAISFTRRSDLPSHAGLISLATSTGLFVLDCSPMGRATRMAVVESCRWNARCECHLWWMRTLMPPALRRCPSRPTPPAAAGDGVVCAAGPPYKTSLEPFNMQVYHAASFATGQTAEPLGSRGAMKAIVMQNIIHQRAFAETWSTAKQSCRWQQLQWQRLWRWLGRRRHGGSRCRSRSGNGA